MGYDEKQIFSSPVAAASDMRRRHDLARLQGRLDHCPRFIHPRTIIPAVSGFGNKMSKNLEGRGASTRLKARETDVENGSRSGSTGPKIGAFALRFKGWREPPEAQRPVPSIRIAVTAHGVGGRALGAENIDGRGAGRGSRAPGLRA